MKTHSKASLHQKLDQLKKAGLGVALAGTCMFCLTSIARAQTVITPVSNNHYYIELKDVSLADALELIFKAAGNPAHRIDEAAQHYYINSLTMTNVDWYDAVMQLVNSKHFKLTRPDGTTYVVEPPPVTTPPAATPGAPGMPIAPGMPGAPGMPPNPFGASLSGDVPVDTVSNAQFGGGGRGGGNRGRNGRSGGRNNRTDPNSPPYNIDNGTYQLLLVNHIYVGGIARLFDVGTVVPTEELIYPESLLDSGATSGGGVGGGSSLGGGISGIGGGGGGMSSGIGGSSGGMGGGISGGGIGGISDRNLKENFSPVNAQDVLTRISQMPITTWNYKFEDSSVRHLGPMAQDFATAFGVGHDDRHINSIDEGGVSLAAIQALYQLVQKQSKQIQALQQQVQQLKTNNKDTSTTELSSQETLPVVSP